MSLVPWSKQDIIPTAPFRMLRDELGDLFSSALDMAPVWPRGQYVPAVNVREDDKQVLVTAELPGIDKKDLDIQVNGDALVLRGQRKEEELAEGSNWWRRESSYGAFVRRVALPCDVDAAHTDATMANGVLTIRLPKAAGGKTKTIPIT